MRLEATWARPMVSNLTPHRALVPARLRVQFGREPRHIDGEPLVDALDRVSTAPTRSSPASTSKPVNPFSQRLGERKIKKAATTRSVNLEDPTSLGWLLQPDRNEVEFGLR